MLLEGTILGHYRLLERIGVGGMGEVYAAEDTRRTERRVAIKVVRSELQAHPNSAASQEASRLFQREMRAITLLDHRNILPMIDFGEQMQDNVPLTYLVMPYRKEGSLDNWLQHLDSHEKLSLDDIDHLISQGADALQHAHDHHIVHQDVKPSNFLIREHPNRPLRPDILLADFGVAKLTNTMSTTSQQVRGTPAFMPPEQWRGKPVSASDQYALAILAYQLMTGSVPFVGGLEQVMYQHCTVPPAPPSSQSPHISAEIDAVVLRALAKEPEERFPSITDFAHAVHQAILGREELQPTLRAENRPPTVVASPLTAIRSPLSQASPDVSLANSSFSTLPAQEQDTKQQISASPPPLAPSPAPVKPKRSKKDVRRVLAVTLTILLFVLTPLIYFSYSSMQRLQSSTPTVNPSLLVTPDTLTVGVSDGSYIYPPEIYQDNGSPAGFDIRLIRAIAQAMKLKINIKQYPIGNLIPPPLFTILKAKQFDVMIDGQVLTDQVNANTLSVAYINFKDVLLIPNGNPGHLNANALTDLCGHTIGVQDNTSEMLVVQAIKCQQGQINIVGVPGADSLANALIQKQNNIEAIYQGSPTVSYYFHQFPGKFEEAGIPSQIQKEGIIIQQDNYDMFVAIQNALNSLKQDGTYAKLLKTPMGDLSGDSVFSN